MSKNNNIALIYYLGENKPNLITDVTNYLTEMEGISLVLPLQP